MTIYKKLEYLKYGAHHYCAHLVFINYYKVHLKQLQCHQQQPPPAVVAVRRRRRRSGRRSTKLVYSPKLYYLLVLTAQMHQHHLTPIGSLESYQNLSVLKILLVI